MITLREEIVNAIVEGFGGPEEIAKVEVDGEESKIFVKDHDEPIVVLPLDVIVPDSFHSSVGAGIRLDVQAILADNDEPRAPVDSDRFPDEPMGEHDPRL